MKVEEGDDEEDNCHASIDNHDDSSQDTSHSLRRSARSVRQTQRYRESVDSQEEAPTPAQATFAVRRSSRTRHSVLDNGEPKVEPLIIKRPPAEREHITMKASVCSIS